MFNLLDFDAWSKTPPIEGIEASVTVKPFPEDATIMEVLLHLDGTAKVVCVEDDLYLVGAQSGSSPVTPLQDDQGFAAWVWRYAEQLVALLGEGTHAVGVA